MQAQISAIEYYFPTNVVTNEDLARDFPEWTPAKILEKTGIAERRLAAADQCSSDLAVEAAEKLFQSGACQRSEVDYLLLCTQSPDYFLPSTACLLQDRLGIPQTAGALDFNLGCSGYVYGLGLAKGLIETGQARKIVLITAETYSKFMHPSDKSVRPLFGDAAAATLISAHDFSGGELIGPFVFGTDGRGAENLIVRRGGMRDWARDQEDQANQFMLEHLRKKLMIPQEKFYVGLRQCGNTVSSTIPIALNCAVAEGRLRNGQVAMLLGFGVGYSWGGTLIRWMSNARFLTVRDV
jgi:3-oxoacyl-[acyl-carrier-protein] synthase-3